MSETVTQEVKEINKKLLREFGCYTDGRAKFRVVWSDDQIEKRLVTHTREGLELINPEMKEVPKYRQYIQERWILERLTEIGENEDNIEPVSYECIWVFRDRHENYLPPRFDVCKIIIDDMLFKMNNPDKSPKYKEDWNRLDKEVKEMEELLFGNETPVTDALHHKSGVTDFNQKTTFTSEKE